MHWQFAFLARCIIVCAGSCLAYLVGVFAIACLRWWRRVPGMFVDGMRVKASSQLDEYEIFDPPPWRLDRWVRWAARRLSGRADVTIKFPLEPRPYRVFEIRK